MERPWWRWALVSVWGWIGDARDLWTAGVKPEFLQLFGFVAFAFSVVSVVARQQQHLEERLANIDTTPEGLPVLAPAQATAVAMPATLEPSRTPRADGRQYSPEAFVRNFEKFVEKEHTDLQREALLSPHLGQWMRLQGTMLALTGDNEDGWRVYVQTSSKENGRYWVIFPPKWKSQLAQMSPGDQINFDACIIELASTVRLANAELI